MSGRERSRPVVPAGMPGCLTPFQKIGAFLAGLVLLAMLGESFLDGVIRFFEGALVLAAGVVVLVVLMRLVTRPG